MIIVKGVGGQAVCSLFGFRGDQSAALIVFDEAVLRNCVFCPFHYFFSYVMAGVSEKSCIFAGRNAEMSLPTLETSTPSAGWRRYFIDYNNGISWLSEVSGNVGNSQDTV